MYDVMGTTNAMLAAAARSGREDDDGDQRDLDFEISKDEIEEYTGYVAQDPQLLWAALREADGLVFTAAKAGTALQALNDGDREPMREILSQAVAWYAEELLRAASHEGTSV